MIGRVALAFAFLAGLAQGQQPGDAGVEVGSEICTYGYIMDQFCLDQDFFIDAPDLKPLVVPFNHSLHCLLDVPQCIETPFHILQDPASEGANYTDGWVAEANDLLLQEGRTLGSATVGCTTCTSTDGDLKQGFRATVRGTVKSLDPPILTVTSVDDLDAGEMGCMPDGPEAADPAASSAPGTTDAPAATTDAPAATAAPSAAVSRSGGVVASVALLVFGIMV
ncbi:expressed unknown protein [Seminavis robusta]|uniref:Uncharacterized protein n=1 Tax=Seminavis robusta TaxID=568900 RepID=A0A9N8DZ24_9STRA|nr:expressed unknown protein [Seminavis robusta]|eukprot:Sro487_g152900.1 n/a (223) ;mRNA; f:35898-36735